MERKIGEIFEHEGEWYQCIPDTTDDNCNNCFFQKSCRDIAGYCSSTARSDGKSVCFKKLEKVGEIYEENGRLLQKYKVHRPVVGINEDELNTIIAIEIKQTKEDMEENKLNLKPFDIQKAREGKSVCTRDGRSARIVCFDRKGYNMFPIVALIMNGDRENDIYTYRPNGAWYNSVNESDKDLMMLPEKHEGWINVIKNQDNYYYCKGVFDTEEYARNNEANYPGLAVATVKIEWEE